MGDLLDVATLDAGHFTIGAEAEDVAALVRDAVEANEPAAHDRGIVLDRDVRFDRVRVAADRHRLLQVFGNLLANAIKWSAARSAAHGTGLGTFITIHFTLPILEA